MDQLRGRIIAGFDFFEPLTFGLTITPVFGRLGSTMSAQNDNKDVFGHDFDSAAFGRELGPNGAHRRPLTIRRDLAFFIAKKIASTT